MKDLTGLLATRPLYLQARDVLLNEILNGEWGPGASLPNETQLSKTLNVSIGTVRKALDLMEADGVVSRKQGRGTFVSDYSEVKEGFSNIYDLEKRRVDGQISHKATMRSEATSREAARLGGKAGDDLIRVDRCREHGGRIFMVETCWLPARFYPKLPDNVSDYEVRALAQSNSLLCVRAEKRVNAVAAAADDAELLGVAVGAPIIELDRVVFSERGQALEWRLARCYLKDEMHLMFDV